MSNYFTILDGQSPAEKIYQNNELLNLYPWLPLIYSSYSKCRDRIAPLDAMDNNIYFYEIERISSKIIVEMLEGKLTPEQTAKLIQGKISAIM